jgi:hypothetical protein
MDLTEVVKQLVLAVGILGGVILIQSRQARNGNGKAALDRYREESRDDRLSEAMTRQTVILEQLVKVADRLEGKLDRVHQCVKEIER